MHKRNPTGREALRAERERDNERCATLGTMLEFGDLKPWRIVLLPVLALMVGGAVAAHVIGPAVMLAALAGWCAPELGTSGFSSQRVGEVKIYALVAAGVSLIPLAASHSPLVAWLVCAAAIAALVLVVALRPERVRRLT